MNNWLQDKRGNWSFTRIAPMACLSLAVIIWIVGTHWPALQEYCKNGTEKLLDFAKWAFGAGKVAEEAGAAFNKTEDTK